MPTTPRTPSSNADFHHATTTTATTAAHTTANQYDGAGLKVVVHGMSEMPRFDNADTKVATSPFVRVHVVSETTGGTITTHTGAAIAAVQTVPWNSTGSVPAWETTLHIPNLLDPNVLAHATPSGVLLLIEVVQPPASRVAWTYLRLVPPTTITPPPPPPHSQGAPSQPQLPPPPLPPLPRLGPHSLAMLPYDRPTNTGVFGTLAACLLAPTSLACCGCMRSDPYVGAPPTPGAPRGEAGMAYASFKRLQAARKVQTAAPSACCAPADGTQAGTALSSRGFTGWRGAACKNATTPTVALRVTLDVHEPNRMVQSIFGNPKADPSALSVSAPPGSPGVPRSPTAAAGEAVDTFAVSAEEIARSGVPHHARRSRDSACQVPLMRETKLALPTHGATCVSFSPRGHLLAVACAPCGALNYAEIRVYAIELPGCPLLSRCKGHQAEIHALEWLPPRGASAQPDNDAAAGTANEDALLNQALPRGIDDSTRFATASSDYTAAMWEIDGPEAASERERRSAGGEPASPVNTWQHPCAVYAVAARHGGASLSHKTSDPLVITGGGDGTLRVWVASAEKKMGSPIATISISVPETLGRRSAMMATNAAEETRVCAITALAFDHTGSRLYVGDIIGLVREVGLDLTPSNGSGKAGGEYGLASEYMARGGASDAQESAKGVASESATTPILRQIRTSYAMLGSPVSSLAVVPTTKRIFAVARHSQAMMLDATSLNPTRHFVGLKLVAAAVQAAVSPDGKWVLAGSERGVPMLWSAESDIPVAHKHLAAWPKLTPSCLGVAWSPSAHRVAYVGPMGGAVLLTWDGITANPPVIGSASSKDKKGGVRAERASLTDKTNALVKQRPALPPLPDRLTPEDVSAMLARVREETRMARRSLRASASQRK